MLIDVKATKTNDSGFTPEEQAELDAAEQEDVALDGGEQDVQPPEQAVEQKPAQAAPHAQQQEKGTKPPPGFVPQQAIHELRRELQEEREKRTRMEGAWQTIQQRMAQPPQQQQPGQQQPQIPDFNVDPIGHLQAVNQQLVQQMNALQGHTQQQTEAQQRTTQYNQFVDAYRSDVTSYSREAPDFGEAYRWLEQNATQEIEARYPGISPQDVQSILMAEEERIVANAFRTGRRPAQVIYDYAKSRGYKKPEAQQQENKLERLQKGQKASASLSQAKGAGGGNGIDNMTLEAYAELMESDPAKADQMWPALAKRGLFG